MKRFHALLLAIALICVLSLQEISCSMNLAMRKPTKQSSTSTSFSGSSKAVDGNPNGNFYAGSCSRTSDKLSGWHWWQVDLLDTFSVRYVNLTNRVDCCKNELLGFSIEVSVEEPSTLSGFPKKTNASVCMTRKDPVPTPGPVTYECNQPIEGRYIRVVKESSMNSPLLICEIEVYGNSSRPPNIALGKPATQSSVIRYHKPYGLAGAAVDGILNSNFNDGFCTHTFKGQINDWLWWQVDLLVTYIISAVRITNRQDCCPDRLREFTIEVSEEEPSNLPGFPGKTNAAICLIRKDEVPASGPVMLECNQPVKGRYLRIIKSKRGTDALTLCEVEVYGNPTGPPNLALGKPATQSTTLKAHYFPAGFAYQAVDGNHNGQYFRATCSHTDGGTGIVSHWWQVDLQDSHMISTVRITNRNDCCSDRLQNFTIEVSEEEPSNLPGFPEKTNAAVCLFHKDVIPASRPVLLECKQPVKGRYLRIIKNWTNLVLCEVEVYESPIKPTKVLGKEGWINGKNGLWRFTYITSQGSMDVLTSSASTQLMIDCARRRIGDRTNKHVNPYIHIDLHTEKCRFLEYALDPLSQPSSEWVIYKLE